MPEYPDSDIPKTALEEVIRMTRIASVLEGRSSVPSDGATSDGSSDGATSDGSSDGTTSDGSSDEANSEVPSDETTPDPDIESSDPDEIRRYRDELLARYGYIARVREEDDGAVLVCFPETWVDEEGVVRIEAVEDTDEAIEVRLAGRGDQGEFESADSHNRELVDAVRGEYGPLHGDNAETFADFMGNHYARPIESATAAELEEFLTEYYPRNVWPTDEQAAQVEQSLRYLFECAEEPYPKGYRSVE